MIYLFVLDDSLTSQRFTTRTEELIEVTEWPPIGKIAAHSAYDMFHGIST